LAQATHLISLETYFTFKGIKSLITTLDSTSEDVFLNVILNEIESQLKYEGCSFSIFLLISGTGVGLFCSQELLHQYSHAPSSQSQASLSFLTQSQHHISCAEQSAGVFQALPLHFHEYVLHGSTGPTKFVTSHFLQRFKSAFNSAIG
jgi:hypothetical protein